MKFLLIILSAVVLYLMIKLLSLRRDLNEVEGLVKSYMAGDLNKRLHFERNSRVSEIAKGLNLLAESCTQKIKESNIQKERLLSILMSLPDGVAILDREKRFVLANPVFERLFEKTENHKRFDEVIRIPQVIEIIEDVHANYRKRTIEVFHDATNKYIEVVAQPLAGDEGSVVIFRDITEMKRVEETRKDFVANVSHELKTPITAIRGCTETLLDGALDSRAEAIRFLEIIKSHTERMERLIKDLISLSKIELGSMPINKEDTNLNALVEDILNSLKEQAEKKGLTLTNSVPETVTVKADPDRLTQILTNLLDNAIKFTDSGGVIVGYKAQTLYVSDTGIGIPEKFIDRLGERFFRVDPSRSRTLGGTGLGLAIVKHLVRAHGWEMDIESQEGKGTTVKIVITDNGHKDSPLH